MCAVCCEQARAFAMFCQARAWHRFTRFACLHPRPAQPAGVREQLAAAVGAEDMLRSAFLATDEASACCFDLVEGARPRRFGRCAVSERLMLCCVPRSGWGEGDSLCLDQTAAAALPPPIKRMVVCDCPFGPARAVLQAISAEEGCTATAVLMWRDGQGDVCLQVLGRSRRLLVLDSRLWAAASAQPHCLPGGMLYGTKLTPPILQ